jgi:hypothetical protein
MAELTDTGIRVRERYAAAARAVSDAGGCGCTSAAETSCCTTDVALTDKDGTQVFGSALYAEADAAESTDAAVAASLGCGVPTAVAELREGETVLVSRGTGPDRELLRSPRSTGSVRLGRCQLAATRASPIHSSARSSAQMSSTALAREANRAAPSRVRRSRRNLDA